MEELKDEALTVAADADLIIYVGGITPAQEGEVLTVPPSNCLSPNLN